jgi:hypothetical protein
MPSVYGSDDAGLGFVVLVWSDKNDGIRGESKSSNGVYGISNTGVGLRGESKSNLAVLGRSDVSTGVRGESKSSFGVYGKSDKLYGVFGISNNGGGVYGLSGDFPGVKGDSDTSYGVFGISIKSIGVLGRGDNGIGVQGASDGGVGVQGESDSHIGILGKSNFSTAVWGESTGSTGVVGTSKQGIAMFAYSDSGHAAYLAGNVTITGSLSKAGGSFRIDHPLDPTNKYLCHSFVESPDMKNVYDGVATLNDNGEATVDLPDWFGSLNRDFRYQLTAVGAPGPNLHIGEEIVSDSNTSQQGEISCNNNSHFRIGGGTPGMKVSWQVTGIRKDPWANANRVQVEENKSDKERGHYLYPEVYGQAVEKGVSRQLFPQVKMQERLMKDDKPTTTAKL